MLVHWFSIQNQDDAEITVFTSQVTSRMRWEHQQV